MVDLYEALKLCKKEEYIRIFDEEYTHKQIIEKYDMRAYKVREIYFDKWHNVMCFELERK